MSNVEMWEDRGLQERRLAGLLRVLLPAPAAWREAARAIPQRSIDAVPVPEGRPRAPQDPVPEATGDIDDWTPAGDLGR
jgi:hypothetical protein